MAWKEAARNTIVPPSNFHIRNSFRFDVTKYNAMRAMTRALPNMQQIWFGYLGDGHKFSDGEDPDEQWYTANDTAHDIEIISNFSKLRILGFYDAPLNGRYPFLFNSFRYLENLDILCLRLKWDLEMLAGFPMLKELNCKRNECLTGNINSLRVLKDTLEKVILEDCSGVEGNFMDLADFPHLKQLKLEGKLEGTAVAGDIRDIGENDFPSLEHLDLPRGVYGVRGCKFQRISDGHDLARAVYLIKKQRPALLTWIIGMESYRKILLIGMNLWMKMLHSSLTLLKQDHGLDIDGKLMRIMARHGSMAMNLAK